MNQSAPMWAIECEFSRCRLYRYKWELAWDRTLPPCAFIGLNPSTADEDGHPGHPLYLKGDLTPRRWT